MGNGWHCNGQFDVHGDCRIDEPCRCDCCYCDGIERCGLTDIDNRRPWKDCPCEHCEAARERRKNMKFVTVKIPVTVEHQDPEAGHVSKSETGYLGIRMTVGDWATTEEVLDQLARKLDEKLNLVDLGDQD